MIMLDIHSRLGSFPLFVRRFEDSSHFDLPNWELSFYEKRHVGILAQYLTIIQDICHIFIVANICIRPDQAGYVILLCNILFKDRSKS